MIKPLILTASVFAIVGCVANPQYSEYLNAQANMETARAMAEAERYKAMAEIAKYGDTTTQVAAMMSMQAQGTQGNRSNLNLRAPKSATEEALEWAKILINPLANVTINSSNNSAQMHASDNNRIVSIARSEQETAQTISTNEAMSGIAGEIQAPAANYNYADSNNSYADSYNADSYDQHTDSYNADSYNDQSDNSDNSDNSNNSDNSDNSNNSVQNPPGA